jgi:hypothetical protein
MAADSDQRMYASPDSDEGKVRTTWVASIWQSVKTSRPPMRSWTL